MDHIATSLEKLALVLFPEFPLPLGVRVAVADQLVAALHASFDEFGTVVVERGVEDYAGGQLERVEELEAAPGADAVAVVAPGVVEDIGLGAFRAEGGAEARAEFEVLEVEAEVDGETFAAWPTVIRPPRYGRVAVAPVMFERLHQIRA